MKLFKKYIHKLSFWTSICGIFAFAFDFGFSQNSNFQDLLDNFYFLVLGIGVISTVYRHIKNFKLIKSEVFVFDFITILFTLWVFYNYLFVGVPFETDLILENPIWVRIAVVFSFIREASEIKINYKRSFLNPAQLFLLSFLVIIFFGAILLKFPNSTHEGISFIDALFTSASAVCVTGLIVVDTATHFTVFGKIIILLLIQIGGLGILTFTSYFSYFFKGSTSYENQLVLSSMNNSNKLSEVFSTIKNIIIITLSIEIFSGILIFMTLNPEHFNSNFEKIFFSIFHSISAFCNAGFSTLSNNLYEDGYKYNYPLQLIIIFTFVLGGLGFSIVSNTLQYLKYRAINFITLKKNKIGFKPWVLNLNTRITLITTFSISLIAFIFFYILEYHNTLADHNGFGKIVGALFGATTPRTAGFNTINPSEMLIPTILLVFLLMWIGASPSSTGGGVKTSTFAIAILNIIAIAKGKSKIEIFRKEISESSVTRSFAIIFLSLFAIGIGTILISVFEKDTDIMKIGFECISAYSTVGLTLGITYDLSNSSKIILIILMFLGRVSLLTFLIAIFKKISFRNYKYPSEEITIN